MRLGITPHLVCIVGLKFNIVLLDKHTSLPQFQILLHYI